MLEEGQCWRRGCAGACTVLEEGQCWRMDSAGGGGGRAVLKDVQ